MKTLCEFLKSPEKLTSANISWRKLSFSEFSGLSADYDFYMISSGDNILYIRKSSNHLLPEEIFQTLKSLEIGQLGLGVYIGVLNVENTDNDVLPEKLISDVESLLIYSHQPFYNAQYKKKFSGSTSLKVKNFNCGLLEKSLLAF